MIIRDEARQFSDSFYTAVDEDNDRVRNSLNQYAHAVLIGKDHDPTNILHRMGKALTPAVLKQKLESLSYYVKVERHPTNHTMYVVYSVRSNTKTYIAAFEDSLVPERTLIDTKTVTDVDPASLRPDWKPGKFDAPVVDRNGIIQIDENAMRPGLTTYTIPWHITKMGYRTILLRLLEKGVVTMAKIEETFGNDDTPEWAAKSGAQDKNLARL
tara:strand:+ start:1139 stop:1777 length:639 start_codon:yes stop_codon:yes gene_type:complete